MNVGTPDENWGAKAESLLRAHGVYSAFQALQNAASNGSASAHATIASWRMAGNYVRRDLALAQKAYETAVSLGDDSSRGAYISLLANGASGARDWAKALKLLESDALGYRELACIKQMALDADGEPQGPVDSERLDQHGKIRCIRQFLTPIECNYLISLADPVLQPSVVVDPQTGQLVRNTIRTSLAAAFPFTAEPPALHAINRRIALATSTTVEQAEPTQILRYAQGQEYRLHLDALPLSEPNQRQKTFLVYLNKDYSGGETYFPHFDLKFRGEPGDALIFANVDINGRPDSAMSHAGTPVRNGLKYILSKWIRCKQLDLSGPPGRPF